MVYFDFTFAIITYNQEKYIYEHLESIKYQIEKYGKGMSIQLVLSDDCSTDRTFEFAEFWISLNRELFRDIKLNRNKNNKGIVVNYLHALEKVDSVNYKMLAGDDLYFKNNIFKVLTKNDFVVSRPIKLMDNSFFIPSLFPKHEISNVKKAKKQLKQNNIFSAPGIFIKSSITQEDSLIGFLRDFKWIEDYPTWYFLFVINKPNFKYFYDLDHYVIYRADVGVYGRRIKTAIHTAFEKERSRFYSDYRIIKKTDDKTWKKYFVPSNYWYFLMKIVIKLSNKVSKKDKMKIKEVEAFYREILKKSRYYYNVYVKEVKNEFR